MGWMIPAILGGQFIGNFLKHRGQQKHDQQAYQDALPRLNLNEDLSAQRRKIGTGILGAYGVVNPGSTDTANLYKRLPVPKFNSAGSGSMFAGGAIGDAINTYIQLASMQSGRANVDPNAVNNIVQQYLQRSGSVPSATSGMGGAGGAGRPPSPFDFSMFE